MAVTANPVAKGAPVTKTTTTVPTTVAASPKPATPPASGPSTVSGSNVVATASNGNNNTGFSQLVSQLQSYTAPTTGDTVHFGKIGSQYVYIGPDGQPYTSNSLSSFFFGSGNTVNPILTGANAAKATTFAALGIDAPTVVSESTYSGPGAVSGAANDAAYSSLIAADQAGGGASLVVSPKSITAGLTPGTYTEQGGSLVGQSQALPPSNTAATSPAPAEIAASTTGAEVGNLISDVTGSGSSAAVPGTVSNPQQAASELLSAGTSGDGGVPGSGSIASMVPVASDDGTTTSSGPDTTVLVLIGIAIVAVIGLYFWYTHKKKKGDGDGHAAA